MGIEELTAALRAEAAKLEKDILTQARVKGESLLNKAAEKGALMDAEAERMTEKGKALQKALSEKNRAISRRKEMAAAENRYIDAIREKCRTMYREFMESNDYAAFIAAEYGKVARELGEVEEIRADRLTAGILKNIAENKTAISIDGAVLDGFVALSPGGRIRISCTFLSRFDKAWRAASPEFVKQIATVVNNGV